MVYALKNQILILLIVLVSIATAKAVTWNRGTYFFDLLYCKLTGCIMNGNLTMGSYYLVGNSTESLKSYDLICTDCIGTTEIEDSYLLNTGDTASGNYTFDSSTLHIDSTNNRVGIGTTAPISNLQVVGSGGTIINLLEDNATGALNFQADVYSSNSATYAPFFSFRRARGTLASPATTANNDRIFGFVGWAYDGSAFRQGAGLYGFVDGAVSTGITPTELIVRTQDTAGSLNDVMVFKPSGNVGIGTTEPDNGLVISQDGLNRGISLLNSNVSFAGVFDSLAAPLNNEDLVGVLGIASVTKGGLSIFGVTDENANAFYMGGLQGGTTITSANTAFDAYKSNGAGGLVALASTEPMVQFRNAGSPLVTILGGGNVGIGTTSPDSTLTVSGEVNVTGIASDGSGKVVCVKSNGNLGTCSSIVGATGTCTCG